MKFLDIESPRISLILLILGGIIWLFASWALIASAADLFVNSYIKPKRGYYTSFKYTEFIWFYVLLSSVFLSIFFTLRYAVNQWRLASLVFLGLLFIVFLWFAIEDDLRSGRAIIPEMCFTFLIMVFHVSTYFVAIKTFNVLNRKHISELF